MLPYVLALVIGLGSFAYYMAAFFFPEVHRKSDFLWSGVGFFYALVLWVCAGRITGAVLLSQLASVSLLGWLGWQTLMLRRQLALPEAQTEISPQVQEKIASSGMFQLAKSLVVQPVARVFRRKPVAPTPVVTEPEPVTEPAAPETEIAPAKTEIGEPSSGTVTEITEEVQPPSEEPDVPVASFTEVSEEIPEEIPEETPEEPVIADITEPTQVRETVETTSTEKVEEPTEETTPPEQIGEFAPDESPTRTPLEEWTLTETSVAETPLEEQTLTETPVAETPTKPVQKQTKQRQGIRGFFNKFLGKGKAKPAKTKEPQTVSEDISTSPTPEIPESSPPDTPLDTSPTPTQDIEETAAAEETLADETPAETQIVDVTPAAETPTTEPELTQNPDIQPSETPEESATETTQPADSEPLMRPNPPEPEQVDAANPSPEPETSESPDIPVADITPESQLSPPAEPIGEGDVNTRQSQDSENPPQ
ncbi:MAG: Ycf66 family protein [Coleofasciculus sp. B1-GNL1-01]|uniref:Ycf66 family protein n=1 Tax=Coleofasciculus sp. B1-GNL1-01 TaxID=3068484 RepID=UPI0032F920B6